jgi:predicted transcriptional regulator
MQRMKSKGPRQRHPVSDDAVERVTVSLAATDKVKLERIAKMKRVSLAWVVRDAVLEYLERQPSEK